MTGNEESAAQLQWRLFAEAYNEKAKLGGIPKIPLRENDGRMTLGKLAEAAFVLEFMSHEDALRLKVSVFEEHINWLDPQAREAFYWSKSQQLKARLPRTRFTELLIKTLHDPQNAKLSAKKIWGAVLAKSDSRDIQINEVTKKGDKLFLRWIDHKKGDKGEIAFDSFPPTINRLRKKWLKRSPLLTLNTAGVS